MNQEEFEEILRMGHEASGVEFKPPGSLTNRPLRAEVVKTVLGMANCRDGGRLIVGVRQNADKSLDRVGIDAGDLPSWTHDDLSTLMAEYADPAVSTTLTQHAFEGRQFVAIRVEEFAEVPVLCRKDLTMNGCVFIRAGACLVRSRRKPETTEIPTHEDMRALLELAAEKQVRKWFKTNAAVGVIVKNAGDLNPPLTKREEDVRRIAREIYIKQIKGKQWLPETPA